jgi:hypothetical protein
MSALWSLLGLFLLLLQPWKWAGAIRRLLEYVLVLHMITSVNIVNA